MSEITRSDLPKILSGPVRFLFKRQDKTHLKLFWFNYKNHNFYFGSSLNPIVSAGKSDVGNILIKEDKKYAATISNDYSKILFDSLKFSFHSSGIRHLKMKNKTTNTYEELYREKKQRLEDLNQPEFLLAIITKRISLYQEYKKSPNRDNFNAVILDTPLHYIDKRQIFELYVCKSKSEALPEFIIKNDYSFDTLTFKLKDNLYLYMKFTINSANNRLNRDHADREIICFKEGTILKTFSFK